MDTLAIFGLQVTFSFLMWGFFAKWFLVPKLRNITLNQAIFWLTVPHVSRYIGMTFLVPSVTTTQIPYEFALTTAYGDLLSSVLAFLVLFALRAEWKGALGLVWIFNIVGTIDLVMAMSHAEAVPTLGGVWYIPTIWVPLLLVSHYMIFVRLIRKKS